MPPRDAHSTGRPAPPPKKPRGPRIPRSVRLAASTAADAYLLAARKVSMEAGTRFSQLGDEANTRREQGFRTGIDECRHSLRKHQDLDHTVGASSLAVGAGPDWGAGIQRAYSEAERRYAEEVARFLAADAGTDGNPDH